jgi:hypothetical protein
MNKIQQLIRETLNNYLQKDKCGCGCNDCNKAPILTENLKGTLTLSEGLKYHVNNKKPLYENVYRAGSKKYFDLWKEARALYEQGLIQVNDTDKELLTQTRVGEFGIYEGKLVPLDFPIIEGEEDVISEIPQIKYIPRPKGVPFSVNSPQFDKYGGLQGGEGDIEMADIVKLNPYFHVLDKIRRDWGVGSDLYQAVVIPFLDEKFDLNKVKEILYNYDVLEDYFPSYKLNETKKKDKKKNPPLNKPKRGGAKKFYVYVRKPGGDIKKVSFGDTTGLSTKINNPKARQAFAKRHKCAQKTDKTTPGYWSCRIGRYWKQLGGSKNFSGYW